MGNLQGRTALITGASRGIGAAVAKALDARDVNVAPDRVATGFAMGRGRTRMPGLARMMGPEDVAGAFMFVLDRPHNHRILEVAFRPASVPAMR